MTKQKRVLHLDKDPSLLQTLPNDLFWAAITLEQSYLGVVQNTKGVIYKRYKRVGNSGTQIKTYSY